ncbi:MAG: L-histidine N(alpha)-methyltransferase, partial [Acidobacteriaceae bacterium]
HSQMQPADALLLGTDMVKDTAPLVAAYNDTAGVTGRFNKNILARLNREMGANFDLDAFAHRAIWNAAASRMEMHLDSTRNQTVHIPSLDRSFSFRRGESIHTESSYKFTPDAVEEILRKSGFALEQSWYDANHWFGVHLGRVIGDEEMLEEDAEEAAA